MSVPSIFVFFLLLALSLSSPGDPINQNDIIRESINKAAGMDLIPKDAKFKLTDVHGKTVSDSISVPGGGSGYVSGSVYTGTLQANASSNCKPNAFIAFIFIFGIAILTTKQ